MKNSFRSGLSLLLALLMLCTLAGTALAEDPGSPYPDEQFYQADEGETEIFTVQVSAGPNLSGAEFLRSQMLKAGFDCFVYQTEGGYRIMCGKFTDRDNAVLYRDMIREETEQKNAYVTEAMLQDAVIKDFAEQFKQDPMVRDVRFNGWETPTGAFVDMTANEEETKTLFVVLYSSGDDFKHVEARRDELVEKGFDACVVKVPSFYYVIAGAFENRDDAKAIRDQIRQATGRWGTGVTVMELPGSMLDGSHTEA